MVGLGNRRISYLLCLEYSGESTERGRVTLYPAVYW